MILEALKFENAFDYNVYTQQVNTGKNGGKY